jgi:hypothetical protein
MEGLVEGKEVGLAVIEVEFADLLANGVEACSGKNS